MNLDTSYKREADAFMQVTDCELSAVGSTANGGEAKFGSGGGMHHHVVVEARAHIGRRVFDSSGRVDYFCVKDLFIFLSYRPSFFFVSYLRRSAPMRLSFGD